MNIFYRIIKFNLLFTDFSTKSFPKYVFLFTINMMMFQNNFIVKTFYLLSVVLFSQYHSQTHPLSELDTITRQYKNTGDLEGAMKFNVNALKKYEDEKNAEGTVRAHINIANLLCTLNRHKESLEYLDKAEKGIKKTKDPILRSRLYSEYGRNYALLKLLKQSNLIFDKAIGYAWKISNQKQRDYYLYYNYAWKWDNFDNMNELDSMHMMQRKCLKISSEPLLFVKIADQYVSRKIHLDSAEFYLNKALPLASTGKYPIRQKAMALLTFGNLYTEKKEYEKALDYYLQSLAVSEKMKSSSDIQEAYKAISRTYNFLDNKEKSVEYYTKYSLLSDKIAGDEKKALNIAVEKSLQEKEDEKNKFYLIILTIVILFLGIGYFIRKKYIQKHKESEEMIEEKSLETDELKKKINLSFDEVAQLARDNDPFFVTRFKEVYKEFYDHLISQQPNLTDHDIKICAYLRLDISSKEIAQYENITVRAVETKKYRLKKKLQLSADTDLKKWILEI